MLRKGAKPIVTQKRRKAFRILGSIADFKQAKENTEIQQMVQENSVPVGQQLFRQEGEIEENY